MARRVPKPWGVKEPCLAASLGCSRAASSQAPCRARWRVGPRRGRSGCRARRTGSGLWDPPGILWSL